MMKDLEKVAVSLGLDISSDISTIIAKIERIRAASFQRAFHIQNLMKEKMTVQFFQNLGDPEYCPTCFAEDTNPPDTNT